MYEELKKNLDSIFAGYAEADALEEIKAEMASVLEDRFMEALQCGVIEEAAKKKTLSELDRIVKSADLNTGGDKQKRLGCIARSLGLSPLGRRSAMLGLVGGLLALCGFGAAAAYWLTRREIAGAITAMLPFAALAAGSLAFFLLTRYRADRTPAAVSRAAISALGAALLCAALVAALAFALK